MNRQQRRIIRQTLYGQSFIVPGPGAIWLLYILAVAALVKYLV
jgi:hypothetical protein